MNALDTTSREYHIARAAYHTNAETAANAAQQYDRADRENGLAIHHLATALALPIQRVARRFNR